MICNFSNHKEKNMTNIEQLQMFYEQFEYQIKTNNRSAKTLQTYKYILKNLQN